MVTLDPLHLGAGPEDFARWAEAGRELFARIAADANEPLQERVLRDFRKSEALEIGGLREQQWKRLHPPRAGHAGEARATLAEIHAMQDTLGIRPRRPKGTRPIRIASTGFKGGTTKTLTSLTAAHYLAFRGWRVLMVDCDPQGTLSRMFDILPELVDPDSTLSRVFSPGSEDVVLTPCPTHIDGLDLIPASLDMIGADLQVASAFQQGRADAGMFYRLVDDALARIEEPYDLVILDTPPAFSFMALTLLWAATALLVPLSPTMADFSATVDYCSMASEIAASLVARSGQDKRWSPVVFVHSRVDSNPVADGVRRMSASVWGEHRIEEYLPVSSAFTNAQARFRSIYETTSSEIDARSLRRARQAADQFGARLVNLFHDAWADELAATHPALPEALHG